MLGSVRVISSLSKKGRMYCLLFAVSSYSYDFFESTFRILVVEKSATVSGVPAVPTQKNASGAEMIKIIRHWANYSLCRARSIVTYFTQANELIMPFVSIYPFHHS